MRKVFFIICILSLAMSSCSSSSDESVSLQSPTGVSAERVGDNSVRLSWVDTNSSEEGYAVYYSPADNFNYILIDKVGKNVTQYTIENLLKVGKSYYLGVRAYSGDIETRVVSTMFQMQDLADLSKPEFSKVVSNDNCITATYKLRNLPAGAEYGLCWSHDGVPTISDAVLYGPEHNADYEVFQAIPNTLLTPEIDYQVCAFIKDKNQVYYSTPNNASIKKSSDAIKLQWNKVSISGLPSEIEIYETKSALNGSPFHAWYAIADITGNVELRVNVPSAATTIDDQVASFKGNCYVMVNGGYFYNGRNTGLAVVNSVASGSVNPVRGSLKTGDTEEYNSMYEITRGVFGVNASGVPDVKWTGTNSGKILYYDSPLPSVKGESKFKAVSLTDAIVWNPKYALSAGPVLLKNGVIPFDFSTTDKGSDYYLTNYEIMPYDIFGTNVTPDRTAVGYTNEGKVILFICDGRIAQSDGATLVELAQIMKGLGCVGAVNFDGGGSTGMVACGQHLNDITGGNRPVVSTIGFFKK